MHSGPFGCLTKLSAKRAELVQKFVPRSRVGIYHNELCRSTPLDRKLTFWCVLYYLDAFGTVWLAYKTRCKTCRTSAKVCLGRRVGIFRNERTRSTPLVPKLTFWCVSYYLDSGPFGCLPTLGANRAELVQKFVPRRRVEIFCNEHTRSHPRWTLFWCISYYLVHSGPFVCLTKLGAKRAE